MSSFKSFFTLLPLRSQILLILLLLPLVCRVNGQNIEDRAILSAYAEEDPSKVIQNCIPYNHEFHVLPETQTAAKYHRLLDFSSTTGCSEKIYENINLTGAVVAVMRGECTFAAKAAIAAKLGASAILNISPRNTSLTIPGGNKTEYQTINITVALMGDLEFNNIKHLGQDIKCLLFSPQPAMFGATECVIFFLALFSIIVGSYWSGVLFFEETNLKNIKKDHSESPDKRCEVTADGHKPLESETLDEDQKKKREKASQKLLSLSLPVVIFLLIIMSSLLLGLYFFYDYLVYVVICIFTVAASLAVYSCFKPLWNYIIPGKHRFTLELCVCGTTEIMYKEVVLMILGFGAGITWLILRHKPYAWILQDILGVLFCINVLKNLRIPSLKSGALLLSMFFIYDIFFVFLTPLFTKNGESVMVDVATGKSGDPHSEQDTSSKISWSINAEAQSKHAQPTREVLPLVFRVPHLFPSPLSLCFAQESLLGFGDIILPGVTVVYSHIFDIYVQAKKLYLVTTVIGYLLGLSFAFLASTLMQTGQPALLYLVPCVLLAAIIPACCRGEFREMWSGDFLDFLKSPPTVVDTQVSNENVPEDVEAPVESVKTIQPTRNESDHLLN